MHMCSDTRVKKGRQPYGPSYGCHKGPVRRTALMPFLIVSVVYCLQPGAGAFEAGAAKTDITAPVGTPLNGYGARMGRNSAGIHDPIWSRALYLDDGETRLFLVSLDLVAINPELRQRVEELTADLIPPENIILTATHTHNGHGGMSRSIPYRFVSGRFIPEVVESTAAGVAASMRNAFEKRRRAALGYAVGTHQGLSANRRYPGGPTDEQLGVIVVEDADGNPISFVTNFAGHPTSIDDPDTFNFSADYPGFYYLEMETLLGPECVPIFLNGAEGNQTITAPENKSGWERTEAVGRMIARRAHEIAQTMTFSEPKMMLSQKTAPLPLTLATFIQPEEVVLKSLEINDLLISFFPGEPCVELGLNLRALALARGYGAHFSVGLSNDYVNYFVPRHLYADLTYESVMTFFGPGTEDWLYEQFLSLMLRVGADEEAPGQTPLPEPLLEEVDGGTMITVKGDSRSLGAQRGNAFAVDIQARFEQRVVQPVNQGDWVPDSGMWGGLPAFVNVPALALSFMGMGSRNLLKGISLDLMKEMEGMAEGARLPFEGLWLLQNAPLYAGINDKSLLYAAPICTMVTITGGRAGAESIIIGRNLDWALPEKGVITRVQPESGHPFIQAGFSWSSGVVTGMNDGGLVLCVERIQPETESLPQRAPVEFMLRDLLQSTVGFTEAVEAVKALDYIRNVHVMVAGMEEGKPRAAVVELGNPPVVRYDEDGLLLGVLPENTAASMATRKRYTTAKEILASQPEVSLEFLQQVLTGGGQPTVDNLERIWNAQTRHSAILLPTSREMWVAFPLASGNAGQFTRISVSGEAS